MSENVMVLNQESFKSEVLDGAGLAVVDFYADWCMPCKMLAPILEEVAAEGAEKVKVAKLNVDDQRSIAMDYKITSIPCVIFFKDGKEVERVVGLRDKEELLGIVDRLA